MWHVWMRREKHTGILQRNLQEISHLEDRSTDGNIKIYVKERGWEGKGWIHMAQDREKWRDLMKKVIQIRAPRNFRLPQKLQLLKNVLYIKLPRITQISQTSVSTGIVITWVKGVV